ncbi:MAG TPA: tetratricopeptide repeat protein, partial [Chitinophagaceae bacterium]|nr:tetratricopeptide repeat protein [Chitinophagaceae bacterium]
TTITGPQTFAMVMGISKYKFVRQLNYADKDAEMFRDFLKSPAGGSLKDDNIYLLVNEQANESNFLVKGKQWLKAKKLQKGDRLFIYLSGHGDAIDEDQFFYLTYDCNPAGDKNNYLVNGAIRMADLKISIAKETGKGVEVFLIMDACRSNELPGGTEGQGFFNTAISEKRVGEIIMLASAAGQESLEDASIGSGHGLFTWYLVDGLSGLADAGTADNTITVEEIQKYVQKNVPSVAQDRFKRQQSPYFCCTENSDKVVTVVNNDYLQKWMQSRQKSSGGNSFRGDGTRRVKIEARDTLLLEAYNLFNSAVKESRLTGKNSAEYYYDMMAKNFPGDSYTIDAQSTLAVEFINFAQSKINLYLDCKDQASIQKIRAQIGEDEKGDEIDASLDRMEKVARQEFFEVGTMLEKAINFIREDDPDFAKSLLGRMYFFKARGYFGKGKQKVDINRAFQFAYSANATEKNAAYVLQTIASLHLDNNKIDSAIIYSKRAIITAPKWRYPYVTLAFCYKSQNKVDSAIKYYRKAIELNPDNADAYVDLGHYFYSLSRADSAISNYEKALVIEPGNVYASNNIGWLYQDKKEFNKAIGYFKRSIRSDPKFINAYNGLSKTFFQSGEYDSARIYYSQAFANYQDKSIVNVYIGNFYRDLKQYDSAKVYYRMASQLDPNYEEAYNNLGRASFALKQYDSANLYYRRALVANPYSAFALINIGMVFKELKMLDSTYNYFEQAIRLEPGNPSILNNLGVIYGQDKIYDSAKQYFRRALYVKPDYKPASKNLLKIFRELNELDSVTTLLKGISLIDPNSTAFMNDMAMAFLNQKRYDSARRYVRMALIKDPTDPQSISNMGLVLNGMKQFDSARVYMQKAYRMNPENPLIWANLALVFRQLKQYDSAGHYFRKQVLRRGDVGAQAWFSMGNFFEEMQAYDSAAVYFKKAIAEDKAFISAYTNTGQAYMALEMYDSALVYFTKAVALDSSSYAPVHNLGLLYHTMQRYDLAIIYLNKAVRNDPTKNKAFYQLACSYALAKQPEQAVIYLRQAIEKGYKSFNTLLEDPDLDGLKKLKSFEDLLDKYVPNWRNR